jgi:hypothetical protein
VAETLVTHEIPDVVTLSDGSTAEVKAVAADIVDGQLTRITYKVERASGAWTDVACEDVSPVLAAATAQP